MRIAFVVNNYPPKVGGVEFHTANLARALTELGHRVWVLTINDHPGTRSEEGVTVITGKAHLPIADVITVPSFGTTASIAEFLLRERIDIVSIHTRFFPMSFVGLRAAKKAGVPVIHTEHGSGFVASGSPVISLGSRCVDMTVGRYVLRKADRVVGVSEEVTSFVRHLSGVEADVFYNAITPPVPGQRTDRPHHLVFIGRMVEGKGWDTFIEAVAQLRTRGFEVDAELIGGGAQLELARKRVQDLQLGDTVEVVGRVSPHEVRERLNGATLINPTVLSEGFQTTLVEAIAEGGRVITFDVPGARMLRDRGAPVSICEQRSTQAIVEATVELLRSPAPRASYDVIEALTWPSQARRYAEICEGVIARTR